MPHYRCPGCGVVNVGPKATKCVSDSCRNVMLVEVDEGQLSEYHARNVRLDAVTAALGDMLARHADSACPLCASPSHECYTTVYLPLLEPIA